MEHAVTVLAAIGGGCILIVAGFGIWTLICGEELMYR